MNRLIRHVLVPFCQGAALLTLLGVAGCKETTKGQGEGGDIVNARRAGTVGGGLYAADPQYLAQNADFYFHVWNDTFTTKLADLPASGQVPEDKTPYSGGFYADSDGGTDQVMTGGKSPLQKYDAAYNAGQNLASAWERAKHAGGPDWAGHCNGFSAASQRHPKEPVKSVVRNGVTFDPKDIKALLAEVYMSADYVFLGGNRCDQTAIPTPDSRPDPTVRNDCEGINPGTLHAAVANWVGKMHHTVILDAYPAGQIWNYPLFKYQILSNQTVTAAQAASYVDGGAAYKFNKAAVQFALLQTRFTYADDRQQETLGPPTLTRDMDLSYILEMDGDGSIVGGEWAGTATQQYFPGFLWVALPPMTPNGTAYMGNQYVDANEVIKMWAESVGFDPANPPVDISRPASTSTWGRWTAFSVTLDGVQTGAAVSGKQLQMHVARKGALDGSGLTLAVQLNGAALKTVTTNASDPVTVAFDPGIGLHRLDFTWTSAAGTVLETELLRFHMVR